MSRITRMDCFKTSILFGLVLTNFSLEGAVATMRLSTGPLDSGPADRLPRYWVAPVETAPQVDGNLQDPIWAKAEPIVLGNLERPGGAKPRTEVRFVQKDGVLYMAVRLEEPRMGGMKRAALQPDGPAWEDDSVEIFLSPRPEGGYLQFIISATGAVFDRRGRGDPADYDGGARAAVVLNSGSWSMEVAIPFSSLGAGKSPPSAWRANVYRNRWAGGNVEYQAWSPTFREDYDVPDRFASLDFSPDSPLARKRARIPKDTGIKLELLQGGGATLKFDLSGIPKGTEIHRARLRFQRESPVTPFEEASTPRAGGKPLSLVPPWYRSFEMTGLIRGWLEGKPNHGIHMEKFPDGRITGISLDLAYEGESENVPPQVTGLQIHHRAGQSFITWNEVEPPLRDEKATWGAIRRALDSSDDLCRYRIYSHNAPITRENIDGAHLLAEVEPLSGYNTNGRNLEYLIGEAMIQPDEMGELARDYNGYMYTWGMHHERMDRYPVARFVIDEDAGPLPPGRGLYVHSPSSPGRRYFAVVSCRRGVENTIEFSPENTTGPVEETAGTGEPVHQGPGLWGPYFDESGRRQVFVQWCAPPLSPQPSWSFNWSILVPPNLKAGEKVTAEVHLHSGNFSYAKPRQKYLRRSIQIAPHDFPFSGWYGFNDAFGTLKSWRKGIVRNHTQQRILAFLKWVEKTFPIDPARMVICGSDGAAALAMNFRERFAYALISGFGGSGEVQGRVLNPKEESLFASAWGPRSPEIVDEEGRASWGWALLDQLARERPETAMPLLICEGTSWGGVRKYGKGYGTFYTALQEVRQPLMAGFGWNTKLITPDWYTGLWQARRDVDAAGLDVTCRTPILAFADSSRSVENLQSGNVNWMHCWKDVRDEPDCFQVTITGAGTVSVTPRRLQKFTVKPREELHWKTKPLPHRRDRESPSPKEGVVRADRHGLFTIRELEIPEGGVALTVTRGSVVTERWGVGGSIQHPKALEFENLGDAGTVLKIDLSALPADAVIYRARLFFTRPGLYGRGFDIVPAELGGELAGLKVTGPPLRLVPPFFQWFDATAAVRGWIKGGRRIGHLLLRKAPDFQRDATHLEIAYEGTVRSPPEQVTGMKAFFRSGQVFISFREIEDYAGGKEEITWGELSRRFHGISESGPLPNDGESEIRYRLYLHDRPISVATFSEARLISEIAPGSVYNTRLLPGGDFIQRRPEAVALRLAIEPGRPLPPGAGLYVHSVEEAARIYLALVTAINGFENSVDFSRENTAGPLEVRPETIEPVMQAIPKAQSHPHAGETDLGGGRVYREEWYSYWTVPPWAPRPMRYDFAVGYCPQTLARPAPLTFTRGHTWGPNPEMPRPEPRPGVVMSMSTDQPNGFWTGINDARNTLKGIEEGTWRPFTHNRQEILIRWAQKKFVIDPQRIIGSIGAWGMWEIKRGDLYSYIDGWGMPEVTKGFQCWNWARGAWGPPEAYQGKPNGENPFYLQDYTRWVLENPGKELPYFYLHTGWGAHFTEMGWPPFPRFVRALMDTKRAFTMQPAASLRKAILEGPMEIRRDQSLPAFGNCSLDDNIGSGELGTGKAFGQINGYLLWAADSIVDIPGGWEMTIWLDPSAPLPDCRVDLTPRRCQQFRPQPGEACAWAIKTAEDGRLVLQGKAAADGWGLVTIQQMPVTREKHRIVIQRR